MHAFCLQTRARGEGTLRLWDGAGITPGKGFQPPSTAGPEEARQVLLVGTRKSHRLLQARADSRLMAGEVPHEQTLPPPAAKHAMQAGSTPAA